LFVCRSARENPDRFYIGIDINAAALRKISEKIHRKPGKGGLANVLFVQASAEDLPVELNGLADQLYVNFPWGSLLRAVAVGNEHLLGNLRGICAPAARVEIVLGLDPERDHSEIERLALSQMTPAFLEGVLKHRYRSAGFDITEITALSNKQTSELHTTWARRLSFANGRSFIRIIGLAAQ
jgi:16S rRNA (adenine(1408)-N(1))-methyltransferase